MGPLANPAGVRRQLIGIARPDYVPIYAEALREIGTDRAMVISGEEGLDELSLAGGNAIAEIERDVMRSYIVSAADVGLPVYPVSAIQGGNPAPNATEKIGRAWCRERECQDWWISVGADSFKNTTQQS